MTLTCLECKNHVDLSLYPNLVVDQIIECETCGITLMITNIDSAGEVLAEIVDEGK